jgi:hypothetical protein
MRGNAQAQGELIVDSLVDYACGIGLILGVVLFYIFIRLMNTNVSEDGNVEPPAWIKELVESKGGVAVRALLSLALGMSLASVIGIIIWETIKGSLEQPKLRSRSLWLHSLGQRQV